MGENPKAIGNQAKYREFGPVSYLLPFSSIPSPTINKEPPSLVNPFFGAGG